MRARTRCRRDRQTQTTIAGLRTTPAVLQEIAFTQRATRHVVVLVISTSAEARRRARARGRRLTVDNGALDERALAAAPRLTIARYSTGCCPEGPVDAVKCTQAWARKPRRMCKRNR